MGTHIPQEEMSLQTPPPAIPSVKLLRFHSDGSPTSSVTLPLTTDSLPSSCSFLGHMPSLAPFYPSTSLALTQNFSFTQTVRQQHPELGHFNGHYIVFYNTDPSLEPNRYIGAASVPGIRPEYRGDVFFAQRSGPGENDGRGRVVYADMPEGGGIEVVMMVGVRAPRHENVTGLEVTIEGEGGNYHTSLNSIEFGPALG